MKNGSADGMKKGIQFGMMWTICLLALPILHSAERPMRAGEEGKGPWWMRATAMKRDGTMVDFRKLPWWRRAAGLKAGESFMVEAKGEAKDRMLVRREKFRTAAYITKARDIEAIVLVIDDDGDGSVRNGGDQAILIATWPTTTPTGRWTGWSTTSTTTATTRPTGWISATTPTAASTSAGSPRTSTTTG